MGIFSKNIKKSVYYKKKKKLVMTVGDAATAKLFVIIGGNNVTSRGKTVSVNVSNVKDVETALTMLEIVTEVK